MPAPWPAQDTPPHPQHTTAASQRTTDFLHVDRGSIEAYLFLCRCAFSSFRRLCWAIFLRRFFLTDPISPRFLFSGSSESFLGKRGHRRYTPKPLFQCRSSAPDRRRPTHAATRRPETFGRRTEAGGEPTGPNARAEGGLQAHSTLATCSRILPSSPLKVRANCDTVVLRVLAASVLISRPSS